MFAAASCWPFSGRDRWTAGWKLVREPWSASSESAHARSAVAASRRARTIPSAAIAAMNCVPLTSDRPSLLASRIGSRPTLAQRSRAVEELAVDHRLALADEREREVRERSEVAARADRATRGDDGKHAAVEAAR